VKIELLAEHPEFVPTLAAWHHREWAYLRPGDTIEARIARLRASCGRTSPPIVYIAVEGNAVRRSAMLLPQDMDTRLELSPWLAGVFTAPEFRGQGIATALSRHVVQVAKTCGFERLYLYTPGAETFYARLGWKVVERTSYRGADVTIMDLVCVRDTSGNSVLSAHEAMNRTRSRSGAGGSRQS